MRVVALEGVNGAGKSTTAAGLRDLITSAGYSCLVTDPAAFGVLGCAFREKLVEPTVVHHAGFDTVIFAALRAEGARSLLAALQTDPVDVVVLERWVLALEAYGLTADASPELIDELVIVLNSILTCDTTVLIDVPGRTSCERAPSFAYQNRFERKGVGYAERIAEQHREAARRSAALIVDGTSPVSSIVRNVFNYLSRSWPELSLETKR